MKFVELNPDELESIEGGIVPFILIGVAFLVASCGNKQTNINATGSNANNVNCSNCTVIVINNCDSTSVTVVKN